jgi:tricarballylate dehydrogenase
MVAIDARAPLYDGGICTRIDCVSLGVVVNRERRRFYDEGEDFWPKRYAIWGRLVAQQPGQIGYSIIDSKAIGRFMPPVFPACRPTRCRSCARSWARRAPSCARCGLQRRLPRRHLRPHALDDCHTEGLAPPRRTGRGRSTRRRSTATRCSPASPSPTWD